MSGFARCRVRCATPVLAMGYDQCRRGPGGGCREPEERAGSAALNLVAQRQEANLHAFVEGGCDATEHGEAVAVVGGVLQAGDDRLLGTGAVHQLLLGKLGVIARSGRPGLPSRTLRAGAGAQPSPDPWSRAGANATLRPRATRPCPAVTGLGNAPDGGFILPASGGTIRGWRCPARRAGHRRRGYLRGSACLSGEGVDVRNPITSRKRCTPTGVLSKRGLPACCPW